MTIIFKWIWGTCKWFPSYWTSWSMTVFLFDLCKGIPCSLEKSLELMLCVSSIGGLWITYINQRLEIKDFFPMDFYFEGYMLVGVDMLTHQIPLFLKSQKHTICCHNDDSPFLYFLPCYMMVGLYLLFNDPYVRYGMKWRDIAFGMFVTHLLHLVIFEIDFCESMHSKIKRT